MSISNLTTNSNLFRPNDELVKIITTHIWARNCSPLFGSVIKRNVDFDLKDLENHVNAEMLSLLQSNEFDLKLYNKNSIRMIDFFGILDNYVGSTAGIDSIQGFVDFFKVHFDEYSLNLNSKIVLLDGSEINPSFTDYWKIFVEILMPKIIISQAEIFDKMVNAFFEMHSFIETNNEDKYDHSLRFISQNNKSEMQALRVCSLLAYTSIRNDSLQNELKPLITETSNLIAFSKLYFKLTPKELFRKRHWCLELIKRYSDKSEMENLGEFNREYRKKIY